MLRRCVSLVPRLAKALSSEHPRAAEERGAPLVGISSPSASPASKDEIHCWRCHMLLDCFKEQFFCAHCDFIQPPQHCYNYFKFFGLPVSYRLDKQLLTSRFHALQQRLHPDRFTKKSKSEREYSEAQSSLVNKAYKTLVKPYLRAVYLLEMHGLSLDDGNQANDQEFLMEMLEEHEAVAVAGEEELLEKHMRTEHLVDSMEQELSRAFESDKFDEALRVVSKMKFCATLLERIEQRLGRQEVSG